MSDEAAAVYVPVAGRYRFVADVHWQDPDFVPTLAELLAQKGKGRPVKILYDMVEQYYRREMVPKVAVFDQKLVLDRRLTAAFPNYVMRRALPLKQDKVAPKAEKSGPANKDKANLDGKPYLFAALPEHDLMTMVIDAVKQSMVYVQGIYLLPMESVGLVQKLSTALHKKETPEADRWIVFMSQHRGGGLRQIVIRNGELSLTRLTAVIDTTVEHNAWATQVAQEFTATMGYVSRFGYNPQQSTLEVIVVGDPEAVDHLERMIKATYYFGLSCHEAASQLRMSVTAPEQSNLSDVLHVAWLAKQMKYVMPFQNKELAFVSKTRMAGKWIAQLLVLAMLASFGFLGNELVKLYEQSAQAAQQRDRLAKVERDHKEQLATIEKSNINVKLVQGSLAVYQGLEANKVDLIGFMAQMRKALTPQLALDNISVTYEAGKQTNNDPMSVEVIETQRMVVNLGLSFPARIRPEEGNLVVSQFRQRLAEAFPDFDVTIQQAVMDLTSGTTFVFRPGQATDAPKGGRQGATLLMRQREPKT
jgi:hypothetical protein